MKHDNEMIKFLINKKFIYFETRIILRILILNMILKNFIVLYSFIGSNFEHRYEFCEIIGSFD